MSVYVGKDVGITVQVPVKEEDVSEKVRNLYHYRPIWASETGSHEAYHHAEASEPSPPFGSELNDTEYGQIGRSEDTRYSKNTTVNGQYAMMLFRYKCGFPEADVTKVVAKFEGYGVAPGGNGVLVKLWNHLSSAWEQAQSGTGGGDETLTITVTSGIGNYIDDNGYIWVLARTTNPSDGVSAATLFCDYASCLVAKARFTVEKTPISDLDQDGVANETVHVSVTKNGTAVTVSSVNDATGLVTLASGDFAEGDVVLCNYRYDKTLHVAQELTLEPKQNIEGIDGLGSDEVQIWAALMEDLNGTIKEAVKPGEDWQARRPAPTRIVSFTDDFTTDNGEWEGTYTISSGYLDITANPGPYSATLKNRNLADFKMTLKFNPVQGFGAGAQFLIKWRCSATGEYSLSKNSTTGNWEIKRDADVLKTLRPLDNNAWHDLKVTMVGGKLMLWLEGRLEAELTDANVKSGQIHFECYNLQIRIDDFAVEDPCPPTELDNFGMIVTYSQGSSAVKIALDKVVFPDGSIPSPKNQPVFIVTPFKASTIKTIS